MAERIDRDGLLELHRTVLLIRRVEERLARMFADGEVPGFIHLSIGQEAVAAGVISGLGPDDTIASTHRGHGHAIAKGLPLEGFFAELLARDTGLCRGRGGSMHVADLAVGMLGANGIVGAGIPIALGSAMAHKTLDRPAVAVAFFGDGALAEGVLHECCNLARLWQLPLMLVCENNGWGEFLPTARQLAFALADLAAAYGLPYRSVDGNDVAAVAAAAREVAQTVREGGGPAVLECMTARVRGHFEGDAQKYRSADEISALAARDPLHISAAGLERCGVTVAELEALETDVAGRIDAAIAAARAAAPAQFEAALADVYTPAGAS
jgi:pyruvate dehydrogenase E1 component alpha subunit